MLPENIVEELAQAEDDSEAMAALGEIAGGFLLLAAAQRRASAAHDGGETWGAEASRRYQDIMDRYAERHQLKSTGSGLSLWQVPQPERRAAPDQTE